MKVRRPNLEVTRMRKSTLKKLFEETGDRLNRTLLENRQLRERLDEYQNHDEINVKNAETALEISELQAKLEALSAEQSAEKEKNSAELQKLRAENEQLQTEINRLKGENFDLGRYAENLKVQLQNITDSAKTDTENKQEKQNDPKPAAEVKPAPEPPKITLIQNAEEKDADAFEYASSAISEAVMKTAAVKYTLQNANDPYSNELITLLLGKNEMFKADVLQIVMADLSLKEKQVQIDEALSKTNEYFDSILGQLGAGRQETQKQPAPESPEDTLENADNPPTNAENTPAAECDNTKESTEPDSENPNVNADS